MTRNAYYSWGTAQQKQGVTTKHASLPITIIHSSPFAKTILQRQLEDLLIDNGHLLYSKLFPGPANATPNILSRHSHLDDGNILNLLTHLFPTKMHPYFRLSQVPIAIDSFLFSVLHSLTKPTQTWKNPEPSGFTLGINGVSYCNKLVLEMMSFRTNPAVVKDNSSWLPSHKLSDKPNFCRDQIRDWLRQQSDIPLDSYLRTLRQL